ncbi:MAG: DUF4430 domain-containing protein [Patescibacteria group bacterium]
MLKTLILISSLLVISACTAQTPQPMENIAPTFESTTQDTNVNEQSSSQSVSVKLTSQEDGQTALELLQANATIETQQYSNDAFVSGINGLTSDNEHYWAFYVNGEYSQTGASSTILSAGDEVEFVYESIDPSL